MKDPWVSKIPCCCCWGKSRPQSPRSIRKDNIEEERQVQSPDTDADQAERAINSALRLSFHSSRSRGGVQDDLPQEDKLTSELPPPSYAAVLKDDDRKTLRAPEDEEIQPAMESPVVDHDRKLGNGNQESVLSSSGDSDIVLTPPTTAPPTVIDEDSEDDERFYPTTTTGRPGR